MNFAEEKATLRMAILLSCSFLLGMVFMGIIVQSAAEVNRQSVLINTTIINCTCAYECSIAEPEVQTKYINSIEYIYVEPVFNYTTKNERFAGYYYHDSGIIELYPNRFSSFKSYMQIAAHEYGHYYYFEELTSADRHKICKEFEKTEEFVSEYASTGCEEYYAVTYWEVKYEV